MLSAVGTVRLLMRDEADFRIAATPRLAGEDHAAIIMLNPRVVDLLPRNHALSLKLLPQPHGLDVIGLG